MKFSDADITTFRRMVANGCSAADIACALGRKVQAVYDFACRLRIPLRPAAVRIEARVEPPPHLLAERDERYERLAERDLTGQLMNDPPPRSLGSAAADDQIFAFDVSVLPMICLNGHVQQPELAAHWPH
jgi:hypothetical protein